MRKAKTTIYFGRDGEVDRIVSSAGPTRNNKAAFSSALQRRSANIRNEAPQIFTACTPDCTPLCGQGKL